MEGGCLRGQTYIRNNYITSCQTNAVLLCPPAGSESTYANYRPASDTTASTTLHLHRQFQF